jgi:hypothetical protein
MWLGLRSGRFILQDRAQNALEEWVASRAYQGSCKGKAHPLQAMQAQRGLGELRLLDFLTSALYGGRFIKGVVEKKIPLLLLTIGSHHDSLVVQSATY